MKNNKKYLISGLLILVFAVGVYIVSSSSAETSPNLMGEKTSISKIDEFAACVADSGAKMYGAFWCSHCEAQKAQFEESENLPYIECSTPDGKGQLPVCTQAGIKGYPTWHFGNGEVLSGNLSFEKIAKQSGCAVPI